MCMCMYLGVTPLNLTQVQDYKHLPRAITLTSKPLPSLPSTASSSLNSTLDSTIESLKLSPIQDDRISTVCSSPSLTTGLTKISSVGDLYASPNRTPTAAARAKTLALQQAQRDEATLKEKLEQQFYKQKAEQRRAATLQRNLAAHFEGV